MYLKFLDAHELSAFCQQLTTATRVCIMLRAYELLLLS